MTVDETWLYHYGPETKQQSMEWRHSGSPRTKKFRMQNPLENFSPRFFGIIHFHRKGQTINAEYYLSLLVQLKDILKGKRLAGRSCTTMPRLTRHLQPRRNWLTWASNVLITHPILRIWPRRTITCFLD